MIDANTRRAFEALTATAGGDAGALAAGLRREMTGVGLRALAALMLNAATMAPERLAQVYDTAAAGWRGEPVGVPRLLQRRIGQAAEVGSEFWKAFWDLMETPLDHLEPVAFTQSTAELSALLSPNIQARVAASALTFPGVRQAAARELPAHFSLESLARCPDDSLAGTFHRLIVDNGYDLEILDRDTLPLADLPHPLPYLNTRILQCHDLWRIAAGYETTSLHEIAISTFQMAQFGHHYSSLLVGMAMAGLALTRPPGTELVLDTIFAAWVHGRQSPPLMDVRWEELWDQPVAAVRAEIGLTPFVSPYPADIFERLATVAA